MKPACVYVCSLYGMLECHYTHIEFCAHNSNFLILAMHSTGLANLIVRVYQKIHYKLSDVRMNVFFFLFTVLTRSLSERRFVDTVMNPTDCRQG